MKIKRYILLLLATSFFGHLNGQKIFKNNDSSLSNFIQTNFFSETFIDSCYLGIHFITLEPQRNGVFKVNISGNLNTTFKKRIEPLAARTLGKPGANTGLRLIIAYIT